MESDTVVYWDASAILSSLFTDRFSGTAGQWARKKGLHLISTLSHAETCAVITRLKREKHLSETSLQSAFDAMENGPWRRLNAWPEWKTVRFLSRKWALKGADLWHLALAKGLQSRFPELYLLSFDSVLQKTARGEGLSG